MKKVKWNVDTSRIASYGGSAGAGTSLWREKGTTAHW